MRELDGRRIVSRIAGRPALEKRLRALLVSCHRFGRARARTRAELAWAARMIEIAERVGRFGLVDPITVESGITRAWCRGRTDRRKSRHCHQQAPQP
jgi:hypothetical protein